MAATNVVRKPSRAQLKALLPDAYAAQKAKVPVLTEEYRALDVLSVVPAGCVAHRDQHGTCSPHVRKGEFAVADTNDRDVRDGEIYLLRYSNGHMAVLQARNSKHGWWLGPMRGCGYLATSDGPYEKADCEYLRSKVIGRVFGVIPAN